uniref:Uncharacterized protein n=1 Tax=Arundo donax TaxID=35708 RepID=A0A0A9G7W0_ARUDO
MACCVSANCDMTAALCCFSDNNEVSNVVAVSSSLRMLSWNMAMSLSANLILLSNSSIFP